MNVMTEPTHPNEMKLRFKKKSKRNESESDQKSKTPSDKTKTILLKVSPDCVEQELPEPLHVRRRLGPCPRTDKQK
jgi:hypothetical protein